MKSKMMRQLYLSFIIGLGFPALTYGQTEAPGLSKAEIRAYAEANFKSLLVTQVLMLSYASYSVYTFIQYMSRLFRMRPFDYVTDYNYYSAYAAPLSKSCQQNFAQLETHQFQELIDELLENAHNQTEMKSTLIHSYNLYQFPNFLACIRQWPEYQKDMEILLIVAKTDPEFRKFFNKIPGFKKGEFLKLIKHEANAAEAFDSHA